MQSSFLRNFFNKKFTLDLILFVALLIHSGCGNDLKDIERVEALTEAGVERAEGITMYYSDSAVVRMRAQAPVMLYYLDPKNPRREFPKGLHVDFYDHQQQRTSQLTAKYAEQSESKQVITLRDSVVIWNYRNERLEAEELICNEREQTIISNKFVKITTPTYIIYGSKLRSNLDFTDWYLDSTKGTVFTSSNLDNPLH